MKNKIILSIFLLLVASCVGIFNLIPDKGTAMDNKKPVLIKQYSSYVNLNEEELFGYADIVALGKVKEVSQPKMVKKEEGTEDESYIIFKDYTFIIEKFFKGSEPKAEVVIRIPGGQIGKKQFVSDDPTPELNKNQILFLKKYQYENTDEAYAILCGPKGKYVIESDKANSFNKTYSVESFVTMLSNFKNKHGEKIVLPPGFLE